MVEHRLHKKMDDLSPCTHTRVLHRWVTCKTGTGMDKNELHTGGQLVRTKKVSDTSRIFDAVITFVTHVEDSSD